LVVVGLEVLLERGALEDVLELLVKAYFLLNGVHVVVALRDVVFDVGFLLGNLDCEFDVVLVELGVVDLEYVFLDPFFEFFHVLVECIDVLLVDVVVLECVDLLLDEEDLDELGQLALERVEHREDRVDVLLEEVEVGVVAHFVVARVLLEFVVLGSVEADALLEDVDQVFDGREVPEIAGVVRLEVDEVLATGDHLVREFSE